TDKGRTLTALARQLKVAREHVLVAGDTLNDLSMYEAGFRGVCVGGSEPALLDATGARRHVLHASEPGCGGILEAIDHFGLLADDDPHREAQPRSKAGKARLVMVYHPLPYEEVIENGELKLRPPRSPNGIIPSLLSFFADGEAGSWIAWSNEDARRGTFDPHVAVDPALYPNLTAVRLPLSKAD